MGKENTQTYQVVVVIRPGNWRVKNELKVTKLVYSVSNKDCIVLNIMILHL